jgi:Ca2+-binding EF-hand superfamily protein
MADQLSHEHESYFRTIFEEFDENGDGVMTKEVLFAPVRNCGY